MGQNIWIYFKIFDNNGKKITETRSFVSKITLLKIFTCSISFSTTVNLLFPAKSALADYLKMLSLTLVYFS